MSWNTKTKTPIKSLDLKELMEETLKNVLIGSEIMNGVTYNKYKNFKKEGKPCLKQLLLQRQLYGFFIMLPIKTNIYGDYKVCIKCKDPADVVEKTKNYCVKCWFEHVEGKSFNEVNKRLKDKEE